MDKMRLEIMTTVVMIVIGVVSVLILVFVLDAKLSGVNVGPLEFDIPTATSVTQSTALPTTSAASTNPTVEITRDIPPATDTAASSGNNASTPQISPSAYRDQGFIQYHSGNYTDAISTFTACVQAYPDYGDCYHGLGMSYREVGKFSQSLDNHNIAISTNEINHEYYLERGATYLRMKYYDDAIEDFNKCLQLNSGSADCYNTLGMAYRELGKFTEAVSNHNQALTFRSDRGDFYWERGITYQRMGDVLQAETDFAKARELGYQP